MEKSKKISAVLALAILFGAFSAASCGDTRANDNPDSSSGVSEDTKNDDYTSPDIPGSVNYKGEKVCIAYPEWSTYVKYFFADAESGDTISDACYKRTLAAEEKLKVDIEPYCYGGADQTLKVIEAAVSAGLTDYDLVLTHNSQGLVPIAANGYVKDWNGISSVNLSKPYYNASAIESMSVGGVLPFLSSDFMLPDVNALFFNTDMLASLNLEDPYALVDSGKWTLDKLAEMCAAATLDINGDTLMDADDRYGLATENGWQIVSMYSACGATVVERDGDGYRVAVKDERSLDVVEKLRDLIFRSGDCYSWKWSAATDPNCGGTPPVNFADGKSLFYQAPLSYFGYMRGSVEEYGILPLPKFDEAQEKYVSLNWSGFMCVPVTARDAEMTGYVVEMLSSESCRTVIPAFYEVFLSEKIARDENSEKVLDLLFRDSVYDAGIFTGCFSLLNNSAFIDGNVGFVSFVDSNIKASEQKLSDFTEGCLEIAGK